MNKFNDSILTLRGIHLYNTFLKRSQYFSDELIANQQNIWLKSLLRHCQLYVPWYSEALRKYDVRTTKYDLISELKKLPVLKKDEVIENHAYFCSSHVLEKHRILLTTSGTTGMPLRAYTTYDQWVYEQGVIWRHWKWAGYKARDKVAIFRSYAPKTDGEPIKVDWLRNWAYFSVFGLDEDRLNKYADYLIKWRPRFLRGYPSALMLLATHAIKKGYKLPSLKAALTASEVVHPELRSALREAFGIEVFDHYGQAEITSMFHECESHKGLHLNWEYGLAELLPNKDKSFENKIVATNLHNYAFPLLRYDTGDFALGGYERCPCGRTSPIIRAIKGRSDDLLIMKNGAQIPTINLYTFFSKLVEVYRFQIIQFHPGEITVNIALHNNFLESQDALKASIKNKLEEIIGLAVQVVVTNEFKQSPEGKFSTIIQKI